LEGSEAKTNPAKSRLFYGWYLVAASWLILFLPCATAVGLFFKPMLEEFHWNRATLSLVGSIASIVMTFVSPFLGRLIDHYGTRIMMFFTLAGQILSSTVYGFAANIWHVYAGRFLGELRPSHSIQVLINHWFIKKRGLALGIVSTGVPLGTLVLSPLSQLLITSWGWRETLFFWSGISAILLLPLCGLVKNYPEHKGLRADGISGVPESEVEQTKPLAPGGAVSTDKSRLGKGLTEVIKARNFWFLMIPQFLCGVGCGLMMTHTVIFATDVGYSSMIGASFFSVMGGTNLIGVLVTGAMADQMRKNRVLSLTHFVRCLSFVVLVIASLTGNGLGVLYLAMALFGFGWFTTAPLTAALVADLFGYIRMGTILGIVGSSHMIGVAIGTYAGGITFQLTDSYFLMFIIQGLLELVAAISAFAIKKSESY
jgi:MFS family permease